MKTKNAIYGLAPALPVALALAFGLTATLQAQNLYVVTSAGLGEYGLDGQAINKSLITDLQLPIGIAFQGMTCLSRTREMRPSANSRLPGPPSIPRSSQGLPELIRSPFSGNDLFVADTDTGTVGEYGLNGSVVNASLITGLNNPYGIAISGNNIFLVCSNSVGEVYNFRRNGQCVANFRAGSHQCHCNLGQQPVCRELVKRRNHRRIHHFRGYGQCLINFRGGNLCDRRFRGRPVCRELFQQQRCRRIHDIW